MYTHSGEFRVEYYRIQAAWLYALPSKGDGHHSPSRGSFYPTHLPTLELFSGYGTPFFPRRAASAHMTKSLALDPHDPSSRGDLLPSRVGIPPRVASIIWNRNFPSLLSDPSTQDSRGNYSIRSPSSTWARLYHDGVGPTGLFPPAVTK
jgi:hypothetical protein